MENHTLPRVFIADPSAAVTERLAASLDGVAAVIGHATNARDALDGIRNGNPRITVLDIAIDGVELLRQIKNHQPPVIVVVLTHSAEETTRTVCLRHGADYFLDKIHEFDKVREIVIAAGSR
jgi:DNA-binding NarL/FixJ family response regulator